MRNVIWFEQRNTEDRVKLRELNRRTVLQLSGAKLAETFVDENGNTAWTPREEAAAT